MNRSMTITVLCVLAIALGGCMTAASPVAPAPVAEATAERGGTSVEGESEPAPEKAGAAVPQATGAITPRMLIQPGALVGPGPSYFLWSPVGATLAYIEPVDGQDVLWRYDAATGEKQVLLNPAEHPDAIDPWSAQWSPAGDRLLLTGAGATGATKLWLLDAAAGAAAAGALTEAADGGSGVTAATFTPDGERITIVQDNDIYVVSLADGAQPATRQRLTADGGETVFNGALDWVYNEELATRAAQPAYAWSPDGVWLSYLRLDETAVANDPVTDYRPIPPTVSYTRYPTAGTANPTATLHAMAEGATAPPLEVPLPEGAEYIIPLFTWTPDSNRALFTTVNRDHTELLLNAWTPQSGELRTLVRETDPNWINEDRYPAPVFIGDGSQFLWLSERDGYMHLYLYSLAGELIRQVTRGDWMIDSNAWNLLTPGRPVHVDPAGEWAYFVSTRGGARERQIDRVNIADGRIEQVSVEPGFHAMALSADGRYLVDQFSDVDTPPVTRITATDGSGSAVLAECAGPALGLPDVSREFVTVKAHDGTDLYAQLVKPEGFDPNQKYPVVVHWYGGSGLQTVTNRYGTTNIFNIIERDVLYTQAGFLVWRLDNRGSFGRGHAFETPVFGELGKRELDDQLAGIEYLKTLPFVDADRIGTDGKSFGGYMTLYALLHAPEVFRCGVSGAPPTDWQYYDTIYTERYMRTPEANPGGYAATNLVEQAGGIWAAPLLIHGLADTNVHLQNTVNFIQALEANDRSFEFVPLPNLSHSFKGDGLVAALMASVDYLSRCFAGPPPAAPAPAAPPTAEGASAEGASAEGASAEGASAEGASADGAAWQTYTDEEAGFTIQYPPDWASEPLPDQNDGAIHGTAFTGPEGGVEVSWGTGFGGACPEGTVPMQLADVETTACHAISPEGTDVWSQINYQVVGGNDFSVNAYTSSPSPDSRDLVLQVLGALAFLPPAAAEVEPIIQPLSQEVCDGQAQAMAHALTVLEVIQSDAPMGDPVTGATGTGCQATVTGTGEQFVSLDAPMAALDAMLVGQGLTMDPMLAAGGPTGIGAGYRKGDELCWASAQWQPDDSANCPGDQPVTACAVTPAQQNYAVALNCGVEVTPALEEPAGYTGTASSGLAIAESTGLANPASENCIALGGALEIEENADGGQVGVCYFDDNRQCEEWALLRGECPVGGVKVTGYNTPAARYCAITGGEYTITGKTPDGQEAGVCTFPDGSECDAWAYYNGVCLRDGD